MNNQVLVEILVVLAMMIFNSRLIGGIGLISQPSPQGFLLASSQTNDMDRKISHTAMHLS